MDSQFLYLVNTLYEEQIPFELVDEYKPNRFPARHLLYPNEKEWLVDVCESGDDLYVVEKGEDPELLDWGETFGVILEKEKKENVSRS